MKFTYLDGASRALSLNMPIQIEPYQNKHCEIFFGGLLPESEEARKIIGRLFHINPNNNYNLLKSIGYDCAGAVSLQDPSDPVVASDVRKIDGTLLTEHELAKLIEELPARPLLAKLNDLRISLAGAQDKAALSIIDGKFYLPSKDSPTTHILKPPIKLLTDSVLNEYFCLALSKIIGLPTVNVQIETAERTSFLVVERCDRSYMSIDSVKRIHQEDFCQAIGILPRNKYQADQGPTFKRCFELLNKTTLPAIDRNHFLNLIIYNYLIGNADAHGKNFSLLHLQDGGLQLAPAYDLLSTRIYEFTTSKMAMSIGGQSEIEKIHGANWQKFCSDNAISFAGLRAKCRSLLSQTEVAMDEVLSQLSEHKVNMNIPTQIREYIRNSQKSLARELKL